MQVKDEKLCSFTQKGYRLQLVEMRTLIYSLDGDFEYTTPRYQIRENRKVVKTTLNLYQARKIFAQMVTNIVLQLKIC